MLSIDVAQDVSQDGGEAVAGKGAEEIAGDKLGQKVPAADKVRCSDPSEATWCT